MKKSLVMGLVLLGFAASAPAADWVLLERTAGDWTNVVPSDTVVVPWSNNGLRRQYLYQGFRKPSSFPALSYRHEKSLFATGFASVVEGQEKLMRQALATGPEVSLHAIEAPYVVLTTTNGPGVGVAADANGDLVTWTEHASPWNADVASSNRVAAIGAKSQLLSDTRDLKASVTNNIAEEQAIPIEVSTNAVKQLRKELIDLGQDVKVLRGIVARMLKQNE